MQRAADANIFPVLKIFPALPFCKNRAVEKYSDGKNEQQSFRFRLATEHNNAPDSTVVFRNYSLRDGAANDAVRTVSWVDILP